MGKQETLKTDLVNSIIRFARERHAETIDRAYSYFWDGNNPDEFMSGTALSLGFLNFEDWLIFDYKVNKEKETFIGLYLKDHTVKDDEADLLKSIKDSVISLYEVSSMPYLVEMYDFFTQPLYKNKTFLHENFVIKGLSVAQVARKIFSSKSAAR